MSFFYAPFKVLYIHRAMIWRTTLNELKARFAGSFLGLVWLLIYPLLFLGAYSAVYIYVFNVRFNLFNTNEYVVIIFCGLIPFLGFAETLGAGVGCVVSNASLIKNTLFPIDLVPVKAVLSSQATQIVGLMLLIIATAVLGRLSWWTPFFMVIWVLQLMFSMGLIWILSSINVFARDLQNLVSIIVLLLMLISPIAYPVDMIPANLRPLLGANPLYYMIVSYQDVLMFGRFPRDNIFWIYLAFSLGTFFVGYWFFTRLKEVFAENV